MADHTARGSDDDYCSSYPVDGHHYISHSVNAPPLRHIRICQFCGHINNAALRSEIGREAGSFTVEATIERGEELRPDRLGPTEDDIEDAEVVRPVWAPIRSLGSF